MLFNFVLNIVQFVLCNIKLRMLFLFYSINSNHFSHTAILLQRSLFPSHLPNIRLCFACLEFIFWALFNISCTVAASLNPLQESIFTYMLSSHFDYSMKHQDRVKGSLLHTIPGKFFPLSLTLGKCQYWTSC